MTYDDSYKDEDLQEEIKKLEDLDFELRLAKMYCDDPKEKGKIQGRYTRQENKVKKLMVALKEKEGVNE